jgi:glycosyltransferase involved in cell wall biosynthesis
MGELSLRAEAVNKQLGREAIVLTGAMLDPRPAYAAADIVVGMGHSGLRGMAFGKPVVIVGEEGFTLPVSADTLDHVRRYGVHGIGDGGDAAGSLAAHLRELIDPDLRAERGALGRSFVTERFGLDAAADRLDAIYASARRRSALDWTRDLAYLVGTYAPAKMRRLVNARPPVW